MKLAAVVAGGCALFGSAVAFGQAQQALPAGNPIAAPIPRGTVSVDLRRFVTVPSSNGTSAPRARVQYMHPAPDGTGRLFVNDTRGILHVTDRAGSTPVPYLDLRNNPAAPGFFASTGEQGLLGFAFHPNFNGAPAQPGYGKFYTAYTATAASGTADFNNALNGQDGVVREWTVSNPGAAAPAVTGSREVIRVGQQYGNHNVGSLGFNPLAGAGSPDYGNLYVGWGDGGSGNDPENHAQAPTDPLGKILRINPLAGAGGAKYTVPADNPFAGSTSAGERLVFALGLRHPQQFSWDPGPSAAAGDDRMFAIDIGQGNVEEVNVVRPGGNYGWRLREGTFATARDAPDGSSLSNVYTGSRFGNTYLGPIAQYDHQEGDAVSTAFVYRGSLIPGLRGKLVFADIVDGRVFYADPDAPRADGTAEVFELVLKFEQANGTFLERTYLQEPGASYSGRVDLRLATDQSGELYLLSKGDGVVRAVVPEPSSVGLAGLGLTALLARRRRRPRPE